jgi:hypothetical protein
MIFPGTPLPAGFDLRISSGGKANLTCRSYWSKDGTYVASVSAQQFETLWTAAQLHSVNASSFCITGSSHDGTYRVYSMDGSIMADAGLPVAPDSCLAPFRDAVDHFVRELSWSRVAQ